MNKAKDMAKSKGENCVLTKDELDNIDRYLTIYDGSEDPNTDGSQGKNQIADSGSVPSQLDERTVHHTTVSSLTSHS